VTYEWPQGWVPIYCICDALIGGYHREHQPQYLEIHHNCDEHTDNYQVTVIHR